MIVKSLRALARELGCSEGLMRLHKKAEKFDELPTGGYDVEAVRQSIAMTTIRGDGRGYKRFAAPIQEPEPPAPMPSQTKAQKPRPAPPQAQEPLDEPAAAPNLGTFQNARTANEVLKAQDRRISLDEKRGLLINKARTLETVQRLAQQERDAILSWPARATPIIAAELGVDEHLVLTLLDNSLRAHLAERAEVALDL